MMLMKKVPVYTRARDIEKKLFGMCKRNIGGALAHTHARTFARAASMTHFPTRARINYVTMKKSSPWRNSEKAEFIAGARLR